MNRETKRLLQRQGQISADGTPLASRAPGPRNQLSGERRGTPLSYLRDVRNELKKVAWPTRLEVRNYSLVVLFTLAVLIVIITVLDYLSNEIALFLFQ